MGFLPLIAEGGIDYQSTSPPDGEAIRTEYQTGRPGGTETSAAEILRRASGSEWGVLPPVRSPSLSLARYLVTFGLTLIARKKVDVLSDKN